MPIVGERFDDVVFALKVPIDRALAHPGAPYDVRHSGLMETVLGEAGESRFQHVLATRLSARFANFRHGLPQ